MLLAMHQQRYVRWYLWLLFRPVDIQRHEDSGALTVLSTTVEPSWPSFLPPSYPSQLRSPTFPPVLFLLEWHWSDTREPSAANRFSGDSEFHCRGGNMGPLARLPLFSCSTCRFTGQVWFIWRINVRGLVLRFILVKHPTVGWSASTKNQHSTSPLSTSISFSLSSDVPCL